MVRSVLDEQLLDQLVTRMRGEGVRHDPIVAYQRAHRADRHPDRSILAPGGLHPVNRWSHPTLTPRGSARVSDPRHGTVGRRRKPAGPWPAAPAGMRSGAGRQSLLAAAGTCGDPRAPGWPGAGRALSPVLLFAWPSSGNVATWPFGLPVLVLVLVPVAVMALPGPSA